MGINGEGIRPKYSILDPELTLTCPKDQLFLQEWIVSFMQPGFCGKNQTLWQNFLQRGFNLVIERLL